jgi:hypothetical protein
MSKKKYNDDDGRQIVDMSGTDRSLYGDPLLGGFRKKQQHKPEESVPSSPVSPPPDKKETWRLISYALRIALLIGLIFIVGGLIFILFCQYVWLR